MHELGHLLLHKTSAIDDEQDMHSHEGMERDANVFAGHLLVPDGFLKSIRDTERPAEAAGFDDWLAEQRKAWGVSGEVILLRLMDAGRLSRRDYAAYRNWRDQMGSQEEAGGSRAYRHREPKHVFGDNDLEVLDISNAILQDAMRIKNLLGIVGDKYGGGVGENDLFIIATARAHGAELVMDEKWQPALPKKLENCKIPAVCDTPAVAVRWLKFIDYIKLSGAVFR